MKEIQSRTKKQIDNFTQTITNLCISNTSNKSAQTDNEVLIEQFVLKRNMAIQTEAKIDNLVNTQSDYCKIEKGDLLVGSKKQFKSAVKNAGSTNVQVKANNVDFFENLDIQDGEHVDKNHNFIRGNKFDFKSSKKFNDPFRNRKLMYNDSADQLSDFFEENCDSDFFTSKPSISK
jgi:hypothetical protein